jgi:hypothetical protein
MGLKSSGNNRIFLKMDLLMIWTNIAFNNIQWKTILKSYPALHAQDPSTVRAVSMKYLHTG